MVAVVGMVVEAVVGMGTVAVAGMVADVEIAVLAGRDVVFACAQADLHEVGRLCAGNSMPQTSHR